MTVGGWFDAEDVFGPLKVYESVEKQSPGANSMLVMGPWFHGQWEQNEGDHLGDVRFGSKTSLFYREHIEFAFFETHLKGKKTPPVKLPEAYVFETGTNQWRKHDAWPPLHAKRQTFYFQEGGKLGPAAAGGAESFDEYISDPNKPVPFVADTAIGMTREYMVSDQRFASRRTDVLVYETEPLEEDLTVAGPIGITLHASTSGTDSDFVVKVMDVYPPEFPDPKPNPKEVRMGNYQQLLRGEPFRGKFRKSFEKPEPFVPGKVEKIEFTMPDIYHTFRRGHRLMIHVQSTWFPLVDRNPHKFMNIEEAKTADFQKATNRVYRSSSQPSSVTLSILQ
jgi:putative CocE/NonD family hydrolase